MSGVNNKLWEYNYISIRILTFGYQLIFKKKNVVSLLIGFCWKSSQQKTTRLQAGVHMN
jgi:hypothetical protein